MSDYDLYNDTKAVLWRIFHDGGTTFVRASCETIALQRFSTTFPEKTVIKIERV